MFIPPKIKHFMWTCHHNRFPCNSTLSSMGVPVDQGCRFHHNPCESITHVLWECLMNSNLWNIFLPKVANIFPIVTFP